MKYRSFKMMERPMRVEDLHHAEQFSIGSATLYRKLKSYGLIGRGSSRRAKSKGTARRQG